VARAVTIVAPTSAELSIRIPGAGLFDRTGVVVQRLELLFGEPVLKSLEQLALFPADVIVECLADLSDGLRIRIDLRSERARLLGELPECPMLIDQALPIVIVAMAPSLRPVCWVSPPSS